MILTFFPSELREINVFHVNHPLLLGYSNRNKLTPLTYSVQTLLRGLSSLIFTWLIKLLLFHSEESEILTRIHYKASDHLFCIDPLNILLNKYLVSAQENTFISLRKDVAN